MKGELAAIRQGFGEEFVKIASEREDVVALTADLAESLRMLPIRDASPDRYFDTGVAEANMVGVAAGLALTGFIPVTGTFAVFLTRAFDHIRLQVCVNNLHVVMVGSHGGVSNAMDGSSAQALEDIAYLRALPNMTIISPFDEPQARLAIRAAIDASGPVYLRLYREPTPVITSTEDKFEIGKAQLMCEGSDVTIVATGPEVPFALEAAELLQADGVSVEVLGVHTIQPIDADAIVASAKKTGRVVTAEDHNVNGGLGSAVAEVLSEHQPTPLRRVGVRQFGESGAYYELIAKLGIDAAGIVKAVKELF